MTNIIDGIRSPTVPMVVLGMWCLLPVYAIAVTGDAATRGRIMRWMRRSSRLPEVHVHGLPLNKDQQVGPVPKSTPWPAIPSSLEGNLSTIG